MKQEPKNEIDILLRNLGRAAKTVRPGADNGDDASVRHEHLDADELNSYAESVLPAATRARYTEHLADCTRCRQIVSQLSVAAGLVTDKKISAVSPSSALKSFFASLFSPMVLRYAIPALAVVAVAWIGFVVSRQSPTGSFKPLENQRAQIQPAPASPSFVDTQRYNDSTADGAHKEVAQNKSVDQKPGENQKSKALPDDSRQESKVAQREEPVTTTDQITSANAPAAAKVEAESPKRAIVEVQEEPPEEVARQRGQTSPTTVAPTAAGEKASKDDLAKIRDKESDRTLGAFQVAGANAEKSKIQAARIQRPAKQGEAESRTGGRADKDETNTNTTLVAGRRFKKEGSVWIDVAYDSSRATVNIARGSEQYRALVADEPEIKTIADQLRGEVIVVWKNRAYRIR